MEAPRELQKHFRVLFPALPRLLAVTERLCSAADRTIKVHGLSEQSN